MTERNLTLISSIHNERDAITGLMEMIRSLCNRLDSVVGAVLVDNGSNDGSFELLEEILAGNASDRDLVTVVRNPTGRGWGDGIRLAEQMARSEFVLAFPSDLQYPQESLERVIQAFDQAKSIEAVIGYRAARRDGLANWIRGRIWTLILKPYLGFSYVRDPVSQLRIHPRNRLEVSPDHWSFVYDLAINREIERSLNFEQIPVEFVPRSAGASSLGRGFFEAALVAIRLLAKSGLRGQ